MAKAHWCGVSESNRETWLVGYWWRRAGRTAGEREGVRCTLHAYRLFTLKFWFRILSCTIGPLSSTYGKFGFVDLFLCCPASLPDIHIHTMHSTRSEAFMHTHIHTRVDTTATFMNEIASMWSLGELNWLSRKRTPHIFGRATILWMK